MLNLFIITPLKTYLYGQTNFGIEVICCLQHLLIGCLEKYNFLKIADANSIFANVKLIMQLSRQHFFADMKWFELERLYKTPSEFEIHVIITWKIQKIPTADANNLLWHYFHRTQFYQVFHDLINNLIWYPSCACTVFLSRTSTKLLLFVSNTVKIFQILWYCLFL